MFSDVLTLTKTLFSLDLSEGHFELAENTLPEPTCLIVKKYLTLSGMESLKAAVSNLIKLKQNRSERAFLRILSSIDYGVYYLKVKEISERSEAKKVRNEKS